MARIGVAGSNNGTCICVGMVGHYPVAANAHPFRTMSPVKGAVLGLGMIGRHHARLQQTSPDVDFVGAVDPGGDRFGAVTDPEKIFPSIEALLDHEKPDFAIVAVPTEEHLAAARILAP